LLADLVFKYKNVISSWNVIHLDQEGYDLRLKAQINGVIHVQPSNGGDLSVILSDIVSKIAKS
jgi:hypothetical protein